MAWIKSVSSIEILILELSFQIDSKQAYLYTDKSGDIEETIAAKDLHDAKSIVKMTYPNAVFTDEGEW